jgi:putative membrane protein
MMGGYGGWGFGMGFGWLIPLAVIGLIVWAVTTVTRSNQSGSGDRSLSILKERYARGEIDRDTFEAMRRELE